MSQAECSDGSTNTAAGSRRHVRLLVRVACLAVALLCLLPLSDKAALLALVPSLSSFVAVCSILATRTIQPLLCLGLVAGLVALFKQRWFCRWVCPMGLCLDGASSLGRRLKCRPAQAMSVGQWVCALTLGGTIAGLPLFLWLDPLALFSSVLMLPEHNLLISAIPWLVVGSVLVISLLRPHLWCRGLCPLGAFQDLLFMMSRSVRTTLRPANETTHRSPWAQPMARRTLLGLLTGAGAAGILRASGRKAPAPLRPPGAVDERTIRGLCTRCGNCIRSCPYDVVRHHTGQQDWASLLTPVLNFDQDYCREDCTRCTQVCPSGALTKVDLDAKAHVRIGLAQVDMKLCLLGEDRECSACMRWCPYDAIRYVFSEVEYTLVPTIDPDKCNGCGACQVACPTNPQKAIQVIRSVHVS